MSGDDRIVSVSRVIDAEPSEIFDLLADPAQHRVFDGSGTVQASRGGNPERLSLGARFGMDMKLGVPYRITNEVVEFEENRRIAWRHFGHHIWRYVLDEVDGGTKVTESFDWGSSRFPPVYEWVGYPAKHRLNMAQTLERLEQHLTA
ncbi:MAG: SRPBCC family protein [Acidimicrobiia bacterium]|nr:SRPBCC family protein [Acidimicrobiia bacterium]